jgi:hypothetical protein
MPSRAAARSSKLLRIQSGFTAFQGWSGGPVEAEWRPRVRLILAWISTAPDSPNICGPAGARVLIRHA